MEKYAQSMLQFEPLHAQFALGAQTLFLRAHELDPFDDVGHFFVLSPHFSASSSEFQLILRFVDIRIPSERSRHCVHAETLVCDSSCW